MMLAAAFLAEDRALLRVIQVPREKNLAEKERIACKAREFVSEDDSIYLDSCSTCMLLALPR
jgi:DeoR/GlpR family transcriptional regulator of sugar metabolism